MKNNLSSKIHTNLPWLFFGAIILLPVYLIKINIFGLSSNAWEILALICIGGWIFYGENIQKGEKITKEQKKYAVAIGLIVLGMIFSTIYNGDYRTGFGIIKGWFIIPIIFSFITVEGIFAKQKEKIFQAYIISGTLVALIALGYLFLGMITYDGRLEAFFNSPNYLAMYLSPAIIAGIFLAKEQRSRIYYPSLFLLIITLYFTYSYAAWLAVILSIGAVFAYKEIGKIKKIIFCLIIILLVIVTTQISNKKFFGNENFSEKSSLSSRIMIWQSAQKILADSWILGIGPGNFQNKYLEYQKYFTPYQEWAVPHPHNIFLAFWLYGGLVSLIGLGIAIFVWFNDFLKNKKIRSEDLIALGVVIYVLLHGLVDATYFKNDLAVVFWLSFFIPIVRLKSDKNDAKGKNL